MAAQTKLTPTTDQAAISLTAGAVAELEKIMNEKDVAHDLGLRVGVKGGGCSGFSYLLGFDKLAENDEVFEVSGITVIMNRAHGMYLAGLEIDYHDGLDARGFIFNNPNADSTCGCGSSFSA